MKTIVALALLLSAYPLNRLSAQLVVAGRVARVTGDDSSAVVGATVVLHRISQSFQGPVDSAVTNAAGRFAFRVARPDTEAIYTTSTDFHGIGYFAEPVPGNAGARAAEQLLAVYDTSSSGEPLAIGLRHVIIARADRDGSHRVLDIVQVVNAGSATRVGRDTLTPVWAMGVAPELIQPEVGQSDVSPGSVVFERGRVTLMAPVPPGAKQIAVTWLLPRTRRFTIPVDQGAERLELLVEDSSATVSGLADAEPIDLDGRAFRRFGADSVAAGRSIVVEFGQSSATTARALMIAAIVLAAGLLLAGLVYALKRRAGPVAAPAESKDRDTLLAQIVALDERYSGREADVDAEEWQSYQKRRIKLKEKLERIV